MPLEDDDEDESYLNKLLKQLAERDSEDEEFLEMLEAHVLGLDGRFSDNKLDQEPLPYILSSLFFCLFYAFYRNRNVYTLRQLQYEWMNRVTIPLLQDSSYEKSVKSYCSAP